MRNECLHLVWKDLETRQRIVVGTLCKSDAYTFSYNQDSLPEAKKLGFTGLVAFKDMDKEYVSNVLFPVFATRLPDRRRSDIQVILQKYGLSEYDAFEPIDLSKVTHEHAIEKVFS